MLVVTEYLISGAMIEDPSSSCALADCQEPLAHPVAATQKPFALKLLTERASHGRAQGFSGEVSQFPCEPMCFGIFEVQLHRGRVRAFFYLGNCHGSKFA